MAKNFLSFGSQTIYNYSHVWSQIRRLWNCHSPTQPTLELECIKIMTWTRPPTQPTHPTYPTPWKYVLLLCSWSSNNWRGRAFPSACATPICMYTLKIENKPQKFLSGPQNLDIWPAKPSRVVVEQCRIQHSLTECCAAIKEAFGKILVLGRPH
jgi:hypothetical protein